MDNTDTIGKRQPVRGTPKPDKVRIVPPVTILTMPSTMGQSYSLMIIGTGDDNIMYAYNSSTKKWYDQL